MTHGRATHRHAVISTRIATNSPMQIARIYIYGRKPELFPSREDMRARYHLVDREVAQLFYETAPNQYYPAFERRFNQTLREVDKVVGRRGN